MIVQMNSQENTTIEDDNWWCNQKRKDPRLDFTNLSLKECFVDVEENIPTQVVYDYRRPLSDLWIHFSLLKFVFEVTYEYVSACLSKLEYNFWDILLELRMQEWKENCSKLRPRKINLGSIFSNPERMKPLE